MSETDSGNQDFLSELKRQHDEYLNLRNSLDNKAHTSISLSSAILTLLGGIGTFLVTSVKPNEPIFFPIGTLLVLGILSAIVGIFFFILSYRLRGYRYPFGANEFVIESKDKKVVDFNTKNLGIFLGLTKQEIGIRSIKEHLLCINHNSKSNQKKAKWIKWGHLGFLGSITCIVAIVLWVVIHLLLGFPINLIK